MAFNFSPGHLAGGAFQVAGLGSASIINIKGHDLKLSVLLHDVTGTLAGGVRARLAGPLDVDGSMQCDLDLDAPPYLAPPLIIPGVSGIAAFGVSALRAIQVPIIVEFLHFASAVDKDVMWDFSAKANSRAGLIVYPPL